MSQSQPFTGFVFANHEEIPIDAVTINKTVYINENQENVFKVPLEIPHVVCVGFHSHEDVEVMFDSEERYSWILRPKKSMNTNGNINNISTTENIDKDEWQKRFVGTMSRMHKSLNVAIPDYDISTTENSDKDDPECIELKNKTPDKIKQVRKSLNEPTPDYDISTTENFDKDDPESIEQKKTILDKTKQVRTDHDISTIENFDKDDLESLKQTKAVLEKKNEQIRKTLHLQKPDYDMSAAEKIRRIRNLNLDLPVLKPSSEQCNFRSISGESLSINKNAFASNTDKRRNSKRNKEAPDYMEVKKRRKINLTSNKSIVIKEDEKAKHLDKRSEWHYA